MGKAIINWIVFVAVIAGAFFLLKYFALPSLPTLSGWFVCLVGLAMAVVWVEKLKWGSVKPFNCVSCLTGWTTLALAFLFHVEVWYLYLFIGAFVGVMYSKICMRYL